MRRLPILLSFGTFQEIRHTKTPGASIIRVRTVIFYHFPNNIPDFHGLICVHDLTNRKSLNNLVFWSEEVLEGDAESGIRNVPTLLIGTKQNEVSIGRRSEINERSKRMAEEIGAQTLNLDTSDPKVMAPGGTIKIGKDVKVKNQVY